MKSEKDYSGGTTEQGHAESVSKPKCCAKIWSDYSSHVCGKTAKFERDGKHYCGIHDPVRIKEKNDKKEAGWRAKHEAIRIAQEASTAKRKEIERKAACFDEQRAACLECERTNQEQAVMLNKVISQRDELLAALNRLEVSANTVAYCYDKRPDNFASALMQLKDDAEAARVAIAKAKP